MSAVKDQNMFPGDIEEMVVSTAQAANLLGVTTQRIINMRNEGLLQSVSRGRWKLIDVIAAREKMHTQARAALKGESSAQRATDARTREIELRIARQERKLIPIDEAQDILEEIVGSFIATISSLPSQVTRDIRERKRIEAIVDANRNRLADQFVAKGNELLNTKGTVRTK